MIKELLRQMRLSIIGSNNSTIIGNNNNVSHIYTTAKALPSDLAEIINILGRSREMPFDNAEIIELNIIKPEIKIAYNNIVEHKELINEYKIWSGILASIYKECEERGTNRTDNVLANIKQHYMKVKGEMIKASPDVPILEVVRKHADEILKRVEVRLYEEIATSSNFSSSKDELNKGLQVIMVDAFIRCKILEPHPNVTA